MPQDRIYIDRGFSGTTRRNRAGLDQALAAVWDGTVFTVTEFDRFARNMAEANDLLTDLSGRGVHFGLGASVYDWSDPFSRLFLQTLAMVAEFEADIGHQRTREGMALALVQLANQTLPEVRRRVTVTHRGRRGRKGNREWELRNRLTRAAARMRGEHVDALLDESAGMPTAIGAPITAAWHAKEDLLDLLAIARTRADREQVRHLLYRFYRRCADADLPELQRLATTVETPGST